MLPDDVRKLADRIRYQLDQDGALKDERDQHEERFLHLSRARNGMTVLKGLLPEEDGAKLRTLLDTLAKPEPAEDGEKDARTAGQCNADALATVVDRARG